MFSIVPLIAALAIAAPAPRAAVTSPADSASVHRAATGFLAANDSQHFETIRA
jgi:hypothetical protein